MGDASVDSGDAASAADVLVVADASADVTTNADAAASDAGADADADAGGPVPAKSIQCGGLKCAAGTQVCCLNTAGDSYSCVGLCPSSFVLACDDPTDCQSGLCCGKLDAGMVVSSVCAPQNTSCPVGSVFLCDPNMSNGQQCPPNQACTVPEIFGTETLFACK